MTPSAAHTLTTDGAVRATSRRAVTMSDRQPSPVVVHSELLGTLELHEDQVLDFHTGLLGFPECRRFVLVPAVREGTWWLQSLDHPTLAFLLVDPFLAFDGYTVDLGATERFTLQVQEPSDVMVLAIVTLPGPTGGEPTANLLAPLVINVTRRRGQQAVIDGTHPMRAPFKVEQLPRR